MLGYRNETWIDLVFGYPNVEGRDKASSPGAGLAREEHRGEKQGDRSWQQPKRNVVEAREDHVGRADRERHEPLPKPPIRAGIGAKRS